MAIPKNWQTIGGRSEAAIVSALVNAGKSVFLPAFNANLRVDLIIHEDDGTFVRVQCKTGRLKDGVIDFPTCSTGYRYNTIDGLEHRGKKSYRGQCDMFAVYCPENKKCYLIPVDEVGNTRATLRIAAPLKKCKNEIRWAENYEIQDGVIDAPQISNLQKLRGTELERFCKNCNGHVKNPKSVYCGTECFGIKQRKVTRPTYEQLKWVMEELNYNYVQVGKRYGVTDNAVRKWARMYGLLETKIVKNDDSAPN